MRDTPRLEEDEEELIAAYVAGDLDPARRQKAVGLIALSETARTLERRLRALETAARDWDPEVDPAARERVGRRLEVEAARLRLRRRTVQIGGLLVAAAAAVLLVSLPRRPRPETATRPGPVRTGAGEYRLITLGDRAVAFAGENADLEVKEGSPRLLVRQGSVRLVVRPSRTEPPFVVASPAAELAVLGTEFDVSVRDEVTEVRVARGEVEVRNAHGRRRLWANETAHVRRDQAPRFVERVRAVVIDGPADVEEIPPQRRRK